MLMYNIFHVVNHSECTSYATVVSHEYSRLSPTNAAASRLSSFANLLHPLAVSGSHRHGCSTTSSPARLERCTACATAKHARIRVIAVRAFALQHAFRQRCPRRQQRCRQPWHGRRYMVLLAFFTRPHCRIQLQFEPHR